MEILEPYLAGSGVNAKGKIIVATVKDDLHDIGKNIVSILLRGAGYTVKDLGNNVNSGYCRCSKRGKTTVPGFVRPAHQHHGFYGGCDSNA